MLLELVANRKIEFKKNTNYWEIGQVSFESGTITLVEDKGNTVYNETVTEQQQQQSAEDYFEQFPFAHKTEVCEMYTPANYTLY